MMMNPEPSFDVVHELVGEIQKLVSRMPEDKRPEAYGRLSTAMASMPSQQARDEIFAILELPPANHVPETDFQNLKAALAERGRTLKRLFNTSTEVVHFEVHHGGNKRWFRDLQAVAEYHRTLGVIYAVK